VLLVNLGTPDSPDVADVRRLLREFLSDPRVVDANRLVWWVILNGFVLPFRAPRSARLYRAIWTERGSPILFHTHDAAAGLAQRLGARCVVRVGMRYGKPPLSAALEELCAAGCERIVLFPLFPQYSEGTSGSVIAETARLASAGSAQPAVQVLPPCYAHPAYIEALAERVREAAGGRSFDHHVISFHGLPVAAIERGDPYRAHCEATAAALAARMGWTSASWSLAFQSRFGRSAWLEPYAEELVPRLARSAPRVLITTPGFAADCLETLEEIGIRLRASFMAAGGRELLVVPALNAHPRWLDAMVEILDPPVGPAR
jgi:ferrochelatase